MTEMYECPAGCGKTVTRRSGSLTQFYCTKCRRRVAPKQDWIPKDFVEIGGPRE